MPSAHRSLLFHRIHVGGRPLLAFPAGTKSQILAALDCYQTHTWKRKLIREILRLFVCGGLLSRFFPAVPLEFQGQTSSDLRHWLATLASILGRVDLYPVVVWPADPGRGRVYVHLLDDDGTRLAFVKLALTTESDHLIRHEESFLRSILNHGHSRTKIPQILGAGDLGNRAYLMTSVVPPSARPSLWVQDGSIAGNIRDYCGEPHWLSYDELQQQSWWSNVMVILERWMRLEKTLDSVREAGALVAVVHGDVNCTNVLRAAGETWILDWEQGHANGPWLTDYICVVADQSEFGATQRSVTDWRQLVERTATEVGMPISETDVCLGLAYLCAVGFTPAESLMARLCEPK